jgi:Protein of unknown function (DUF2844)
MGQNSEKDNAMNKPLSVPVFLLMTLLPLDAAAELGGQASAMAQEAVRFKAVRRATLGNGYTVHELQTDNGITIREYAATSGRIFAVSWNGPVLPDLTALLGGYFPAFKQAVDARRSAGLRGPVAIEQDDLVVHSGGRMRAFHGRAWVPSLLPPQVTIAELQ